MKTYQTFVLHDAAAATGNGQSARVGNADGFAVHVVNLGTPVGTVNFENRLVDTAQASDWVACPMEDATGALVTTSTTAGYFRSPHNAVIGDFRARLVYTSGAWTVRAGRR